MPLLGTRGNTESTAPEPVSSRSARQLIEHTKTTEDHRSNTTLQQSPYLKAADPVCAAQPHRHTNNAEQDANGSSDPSNTYQEVHQFSNQIRNFNRVNITRNYFGHVVASVVSH